MIPATEWWSVDSGSSEEVCLNGELTMDKLK